VPTLFPSTSSFSSSDAQLSSSSFAQHQQHRQHHQQTYTTGLASTMSFPNYSSLFTLGLANKKPSTSRRHSLKSFLKLDTRIERADAPPLPSLPIITPVTPLTYVFSFIHNSKH
jgi:hypothetical protein